jgi:hypothetical protein
MAEPANPHQTIEKPPTLGTPPTEPAMFVMPEEYRHGAIGKKKAVPSAPPKPAPTAPPPPPRPPAPPKPALPAKKKGLSKSMKVMLVAGGILVLVLAIGGFLLLRSLQPEEPRQPERPQPTTRPAPTAEEKPEEQPAEEEKPEETVSPFPTAAKPGTDSDSDGLTDLEERIIYSTNPRLPDSDSDGFLDGNEVFHRYNPSGTAPGTLLESGLVKQFEGERYRVLYPSIWSTTDDTFVATTGESIVVSLIAKSDTAQTLSAWHAATGNEEEVEPTTTKNGYDMLVAENQLTAYIADTDAVIKFEYRSGIKGTVDYLQTFKMMVNSLEWL